MENHTLDPDKISGVWSAAPTPLTEDMRVHIGDIKRMVDHHLTLDINGLFLAGTNGEGPWLPVGERRILVKEVVQQTAGRMIVAVQVTDNSSARIIDNMKAAADDGADMAVIAPPNFFYNATPDNLRRHYIGAVRNSPLPVGIYDRGDFGPVKVPRQVLESVYDEENVILIKDSSTKMKNADVALAARKKRPELRLLDGDEFNCVKYLQKGYDGLLLGGGVFNGFLAGKIITAVADGKIKKANALQKRMNRIMYAVYGGKDISCWLSGEKKLLVDMGILSTWKNFPNYPLTKKCIKNIAKVLEKDTDILLPGIGD